MIDGSQCRNTRSVVCLHPADTSDVTKQSLCSCLIHPSKDRACMRRRPDPWLARLDRYNWKGRGSTVPYWLPRLSIVLVQGQLYELLWCC